MGALIAFMAWQIAILPYVFAVSVGLGLTLLGVVFFWKAFWPEHWLDDEVG
jgi:hypothetical protein